MAIKVNIYMYVIRIFIMKIEKIIELDFLLHLLDKLATVNSSANKPIPAEYIPVTLEE